MKETLRDHFIQPAWRVRPSESAFPPKCNVSVIPNKIIST